MAALFGADVQRLRELADRLTERAGVLREAASAVSGQMQSTTWAGPDAEDFGARWETVDRVSMTACADALEAGATRLRANADQQEAASAADDGGVMATAGGAAMAFGAGGAGGEPSGFPAMAGAGPAAMAGPNDMPPEAKDFLAGVDGGWSAAKIHGQWGKLDQATRDWLLTYRPWRMGNLDGIPYQDRDTANRNQVAHRLDKYDAEYDRLKAELEAAWEVNPPTAQQIAMAPDYLHGHALIAAGLTGESYQALLNIREQLGTGEGPRTEENKEAYGILGTEGYLVAFDLTHDNARAAISVGDLDGATQVGVYVPGISTRISGDLDGYMKDMTNLRRETNEVLRDAGVTDPKTAQVFWLDYSAPAGVEDFPSTITAAGKNRAREGGDNLADFGDGLEAVNPDARKTVAAHSYGSTTSGYALDQTDAFDSCVMFGSPGLAVTYPDEKLHETPQGTIRVPGEPVLDMNIPENERYYLEAKGDAVTNIPKVIPYPVGQGVAPGELGFHRLTTEARPASGYMESTGHSEYLKDESSSQRGIAAVIAGHPEEAPRR